MADGQPKTYYGLKRVDASLDPDCLLQVGEIHDVSSAPHIDGVILADTEEEIEGLKTEAEAGEDGVLEIVQVVITVQRPYPFLED